MCLNAEWTAGGTANVTGPVRITHTFHPQCGQEIQFVARHDQWGEDRVFFRSARGHLASLPARWTSLAPQQPVVGAGGGPARFRVDDLLELSALLGRLGA